LREHWNRRHRAGERVSRERVIELRETRLYGTRELRSFRSAATKYLLDYKFSPRSHTLPRRALTSAKLSQPADIPPETEWFAYRQHEHSAGVPERPSGVYYVRRDPVADRALSDHPSPSNCLAQGLGPPETRSRLGPAQNFVAVVPLRVHDRSDRAVATTPVKGVKRPKVDSYEARRRRSRITRWLCQTTKDSETVLRSRPRSKMDSGGRNSAS
jgi:hypothetical protein